MGTRLAFLGIALCYQLNAGDVVGQVEVSSKLSKPVIRAINYSQRGVDVSERSAIPDSGKMVILLEGAGQPPTPAAAELIQDAKQFNQDLLVIPTGSTVSFPNTDPIFHNVFSLSKAKPFDLGYYPQGQTRKVTFSKPGIVQVYCHIHSNMYAVIVVTNSPHSVKPAADGSFALRGVPAGSYEMLAWHNAAGLTRQTISVSATGETRLVVKIPYIYADQK